MSNAKDLKAKQEADSLYWWELVQEAKLQRGFYRNKGQVRWLYDIFNSKSRIPLLTYMTRRDALSHLRVKDNGILRLLSDSSMRSYSVSQSNVLKWFSKAEFLGLTIPELKSDQENGHNSED